MKQFNLKLPPYPGSSVCVRIGKPPSVDISALRENYVSPELLESKVSADPFDQVLHLLFYFSLTGSLKGYNPKQILNTARENYIERI